jgi:protoheme IX farnesyltransferase
VAQNPIAPTRPAPSPSGHAAPTADSPWPALVETAKPGITRLVTITAVLGFALEALASLELTWPQVFLRLAVVAVGSALSSAGANALNMWMEPDRDARMSRTRQRPLPSGSLTPNGVLAWGIALSTIGVLSLMIIGPAPGLIALAGVVLYVLVYTPLKPTTVWNTVVGAVPGAVPPLIGATAATTAPGFDPLLRPLGWSLFAVMVIWQIPHFLAIAWKYRDDYAQAGLRMLPSVDPTGVRTGIAVVSSSFLLMLISFTPLLAAPDIVGTGYAAVAGLTGMMYLWLSVRLAQRRDDASARAVFFASIIHLPVLFLALTVEAAFRVLLAS